MLDTNIENQLRLANSELNRRITPVVEDVTVKRMGAEEVLQ